MLQQVQLADKSRNGKQIISLLLEAVRRLHEDESASKYIRRVLTEKTATIFFDAALRKW